MSNQDITNTFTDSSLRLKSIEAKIVLLGSQGVGKSCLCLRYVNNIFDPYVSPTVGASFFTGKLKIDDYKVKLQIWDTAGQERFRSMAPMYYRNAQAAILVYDITNVKTFLDLKQWQKGLAVIGNKSDLENIRAVAKSDGQSFAEEIGATFAETSALAAVGINEAMNDLARQLIDMKNGVRLKPGGGKSSSKKNKPPRRQQSQPVNLTLKKKPENNPSAKRKCCSQN